MALSPMMKQYLSKKKEHEDSILFFRLGDFYEMFYDDAVLVSKELDLVLTGKQCGEEEKAPMCGVPYHSADTYIGKLVDRGYKVVICEQTEDPALAKGLVSRDVVRIITPGTVTDQAQLSEEKNNYIAAFVRDGNEASICFADITTGEIRACTREDSEPAIINELSVYQPRELLVPEGALTDGLSDYVKNRLCASVNTEKTDSFELSACRKDIEQFLCRNPDDMAVNDGIIRCMGVLVRYIAGTQMTDISYIKDPVIYGSGDYLEMDSSSRRSLEITENLADREKKGSLLWVLDKTRTSFGARLLRKWISMPLKDPARICARQDAVGELAGDYMLRQELSELLSGVLDAERIMTRILYKTAGGRDVRALYRTISVLPSLKKTLLGCRSGLLLDIASSLDTLEDLSAIIDRTITEDPPFSVREGGFIKEGINEELDRLRSVLHGSKGYLEDIERREREATGIKNLKVGYNKVFGYYIEISKSNLSEVPASYIRKQTLTGGERYITEELKQLENTILGAADKINAIEYDIFSQICDHIAENTRRVQAAAEAMATVDVLLSFAQVAAANGYVRPEVDIGDVIDIRDGRHPVVELFCTQAGFVPNDLFLDTGNHRLILLTGPNMAGKSTYMRQTALICLMAQAGSFVPASSARVGIIDKIFTRVGASDDLAGGRSTFMLEMTEVAYILKNATPRSLVIYDEIGRGTSTYDGMSIARAVAEYTAEKKKCRTLFATHYHELCRLEDSVQGIENFSVTACKKDKGIVFLRKIVKGAAPDSYGIEVAQLAGVPAPVIKHAKKILSELEDKAPSVQAAPKDDGSLSFDDYVNKETADRIRMADTENMTPLEALVFLTELRKKLL